MTGMPAASNASRVRSRISWPNPVIAFAISGSKNRHDDAPSTPNSAFIMILIAWSAWRSPRCFAAARRSMNRSMTPGRIAPSRAKRAPPGASIAVRALARERVRERIEREGPDQARIQALEVEHRDALEHARHRVEHGAAAHERVRAFAATLGAANPRRRSSGR
jgi:hypothetical protein